MKKSIIPYFLLFCLLFVIFVSCDSASAQTQEEYFYQINTMIKDVDFVTAQVDNFIITLFDSQNKVMEEIHFEGYTSKIPILCIKKKDNVIRFIYDGDVDDENGIIFINNESNSILDGIKSIKRIGGNSYEYSTYD